MNYIEDLCVFMSVLCREHCKKTLLKFTIVIINTVQLLMISVYSQHTMQCILQHESHPTSRLLTAVTLSLMHQAHHKR